MTKCYVFDAPAAGSSILTSAIYPNADGGVVSIQWSGDFDPVNGGGWETSYGSISAGYSFTHFDALINAQIGYGAQSIVVVLSPVSFGGVNKSTPQYVFTSGWATSISSPTGQLYTGNGTTYSGAGTIPAGTCAQGVDNTAMPMVFQAPFVTAWKNAITAALEHIQGASYASKIAYVRIGGTTGGQMTPNAANAMLTQVTPSTYAELMSMWGVYAGELATAITSASVSFPCMLDAAGGLGTYIPDISYDWSNTIVATATASGLGFGNQGLGSEDIIAYTNKGATNGGSATSGWPGGNFVYLFGLYPSAPVHELQTVSASNPLNTGETGSLVPLIPFAVARGATSLELYYQDWQIAYDPSNEYNATYGAAYQTAIQNARSPVTPILVPVDYPIRFFDASNNPLANGKVTFQLNTDASSTVPGGPQVSAGKITSATLDDTGSATPSFFPNDQLFPPNTVYFVKAYTAQGLIAWQGQVSVATIPPAPPIDYVFTFFQSGTGTLRGTIASGVINTIPLTSSDPIYGSAFGSSFGMALDNGTAIVCDSGKHAIFQVSSSGVVTRIAGTGGAGTPGYVGPALSAAIVPQYCAVDAAGNIYAVANGGDIVFALNTQTTTQTILNVSIPSGDLAIVAGTLNTPGFSGDTGAAISAKLNTPRGIALDTSGNLYICDYQNNRIRKVVASTGIITTVVGTGTSGHTGDGGPALSAEIENPFFAACFDTLGNFYFAEANGYIRVVNFTGSTQTVLGVTVASGDIETVCGTGVFGGSGYGGPALSAEIKQVEGMFCDSSGTLYFNDPLNAVVLKVTTSGILDIVAGTGTAGNTGDGGQATSAEIQNPSALIGLWSQT